MKRIFSAKCGSLVLSCIFSPSLQSALHAKAGLVVLLRTPVRSAWRDKPKLFAQYLSHPSPRSLTTRCFASRTRHSPRSWQSHLPTSTLSRCTPSGPRQSARCPTWREPLQSHCHCRVQYSHTHLHLSLAQWPRQSIDHDHSCKPKSELLPSPAADRLVPSSNCIQRQSPESRFLFLLHDADAFGHVRCNTHDTKSWTQHARWRCALPWRPLWGWWRHKLFHWCIFVDIAGHCCWTTAAWTSSFFLRPHACSSIQRHYLQEFFAFSVWQLAVRL